MRRPRPRRRNASRVRQRVIHAEVAIPFVVSVNSERSLQRQRQRKALPTQRKIYDGSVQPLHRLCTDSRPFPRCSHSTRHRSPWSGTWATPSCVFTVQAATEGKHSSHPLASPCIETPWCACVGLHRQPAGACRSSRLCTQIEAILPPNCGSTVTAHSPAWMRTFSFSPQPCQLAAIPHCSPISHHHRMQSTSPRSQSSHVLMLRLHQHRSQASDDLSIALSPSPSRQTRIAAIVLAPGAGRVRRRNQMFSAPGARTPSGQPHAMPKPRCPAPARPGQPAANLRIVPHPPIQFQRRRAAPRQPVAQTPRPASKAKAAASPTTPPPPPQPVNTPG